MAGFIHDRVGTGGLRISVNRGPKKTPSQKIVLDGSQGVISKTSLARLLGDSITEDFDWKIKFFGQTLMDTLQGDPPNGTPVLTGLARANWQLSVVRSARAIGHVSRVLHRDVLEAKNWNGWKANEAFRGEIPIPPEHLRGITELDKFSSANGDYGIIITNPIPYINKLNNGYSKKTPANFVQRAIAYALQEARRV